MGAAATETGAAAGGGYRGRLLALLPSALFPPPRAQPAVNPVSPVSSGRGSVWWVWRTFARR